MLNPRSTSPPNSSSDSTASVVVLTVRIVRDSVSLSARLIRSRNGIVRCLRIDSRTRS
ncbi:hypothetical protein D3C83_298030 [compost metagenome]